MFTLCSSEVVGVYMLWALLSLWCKCLVAHPDFALQPCSIVSFVTACCQPTLGAETSCSWLLTLAWCRWLWANASAQYDVLAIASEGQAAQVEQACPHCIYVYAHTLDPVAGRYAALYQLIHQVHWQTQIAGKYNYIYFPEEEIVQAVGSINR